MMFLKYIELHCQICSNTISLVNDKFFKITLRQLTWSIFELQNTAYTQNDQKISAVHFVLSDSSLVMK